MYLRIATFLASLFLVSSCAQQSKDTLDAGAIDSGGLDLATPRPSLGCTSKPQTYLEGDHDATISVGATNREFRLHVPGNYSVDAPAPVFILLHGGGGSGVQMQAKMAQLELLTDQVPAIAVYPSGSKNPPRVVRSWNAGQCCGGAQADNVDDIGFISALIDHLESGLCVDERRIYVAGMSNGGMLSHRIGCELADRIAAIGPVAGTIQVSGECSPSRPIPIMVIHGTDDLHVPWRPGVGCGIAEVNSIGIPSTLDIWSANNGCGDAPPRLYFEEGNGRCTSHVGCQADVVLCAISGGGHSWPGGAPELGLRQCSGEGEQSTTFGASHALLEFFRTHPMP